MTGAILDRGTSNCDDALLLFDFPLSTHKRNFGRTGRPDFFDKNNEQETARAAAV